MPQRNTGREAEDSRNILARENRRQEEDQEVFGNRRYGSSGDDDSRYSQDERHPDYDRQFRKSRDQSGGHDTEGNDGYRRSARSSSERRTYDDGASSQSSGPWYGSEGRYRDMREVSGTREPDGFAAGSERRNQPRFRGVGPKGYERSDDRLKEQVCDALAEDDDLDASDIEVNVISGEVTLDGRVDSRWAKRHAEDCVESLAGVKHCQNNLRVGREPQSHDPAVSNGPVSRSGKTKQN